MSISIIALTQQGIETALKIKAVIGGQVCGLSPRTKGADTSFQNATDFIGKQFASGDTIVGICASGILVRAIGAYVGSKKTDSPVIAVSEKGDTVVPLLGGHYGGNDIAGKIANLFNATPSITSAGDITLGFSFDNLPVGWTVSNTDLIKPITAQLLDDGDVRLLNDCSVIFPNTNVFKGDKFTVHITDKSGFENDTTLVIYPPILNIGVGLERKCDGQGFIEFIESVLNKHGFAHQAISSFASIDIKVDEPAIKALSTHFNKPIRFFTAEQLNAQKSNLKNPSDIVFKETGCYGVAEGACLTLGGTLSIEKEKSTKHTMAISKLTTPSLPNNGRKCGKLNVVGIGAGERQWRTPQANRALLESDIFVGYKLYLDMIGDVIGNKPTADSQLGQEEARARKAIELASTGQTVSLVCSGDASIYALATLVFEILDRNPDNRAWQGINIECCPGISAFQAGSSRLGAPFNHDFCLVSLSDLLTPREAILQRLETLGQGDFVVAFYNPQSKRRRTLLKEAQSTLLKYRPETTPVAIGRNIGREGEQMTITTLKDFEPEMVDMLSLVIIGSSETKTFVRAGQTHMYTPRGYAKKMID